MLYIYMHTLFTADPLMQTIRLHELKKPARGAERGAHCSQNTQPQLKSSKPSFKLQLHHHGNGIHQHQEACDIPERRNSPFQTAMVKHRFYTKRRNPLSSHFAASSKKSIPNMSSKSNVHPLQPIKPRVAWSNKDDVKWPTFPNKKVIVQLQASQCSLPHSIFFPQRNLPSDDLVPVLLI